MDESVFSRSLPTLRAPRAACCEVQLCDIEVMADIGAFESEIGVLQPLRIDVVLRIVPPARDSLAHTFDYSAIQAFASELAIERTVLIETFAMKLAQRCLVDDRVIEAQVRIDKPRAIPGCMAGTRITLSQYPP
ncbi:dihydroneopterin aldolase [Robbsia sp. KACC 23696]|uniref:dihydroneopterin aldolase n=1 Tax=Robbsia sp. KACC 23696 TaxID=3149231 RepID=UPI00325B3885